MSDTPSATVLVSSGYRQGTLAVLRRAWTVIDIPDPGEALDYLRRTRPMPEAVAIGFARPYRDESAHDADHARRMPAHVMLRQIHEVDPDLPVVISTGEQRPDVIVDLVRLGAFDYVVEPHHVDDADSESAWRLYTHKLRLALERAVRWRRTVLENRWLKQRISAPRDREDLKLEARSPAMLRVMELLRKAAPTSATVLITGESGTGKELAARTIHELSPRHNKPWLAINCGAMSDALLTSELFGHVRGAFTGADRDQPGLIQQASGGTLFLDELGAISSAFQVMLLRVLEQRVARPVGGREDYPVRCRFVAAANRDLDQMVCDGTFREDLYYRLNVLHVHLPPLRERPEEIPLLAQRLLVEAAAAHHKPVEAFEPEAMRLLEQHTWPGNVRQLRNVIERAVILTEHRHIQPQTLNLHATAPGAPDHSAQPEDLRGDYQTQMQRFESQLIHQALQRHQGNRSAAARTLGIKRSTLNYRIKHLGIA